MSLVGTLMVVGLLCTPAWAESRAEKPVIVISGGGYNATMADVAAIGEMAGQPELDKQVEAFLKLFTKGQGLAGVDKTRPWGVALFPRDDKPAGYAFVPVTDLKALLKLAEDFGHKSSDAGEGLIEIDTKQEGKRLLVRQHKGWAFFSDKPENLAHVPDDPGKLVVGMAKQYDLAVRLNISNVPAKDREKLVKALRAEAKKQLERAKGTESQQAVGRMIARMVLGCIETATKELEQVTIGGSFDQKAKSISLGMNVTALEGTATAAKFAQLKQSKTNLAGFTLPEAALTASCAVQCADVNTKAIAALFTAIEKAAFEAIDEKVDAEKKAQGMKKFVGGMLRVASETAATGRLDRRVSLVMKPDGVTLVGASHVANGPDLEKTLGMLLKVARQKHGDVVDKVFKPNAEEYRGVKLHVLSIPITDKHKDHNAALALLGKNIEVVFGVAPEAVGFAAGRDAMKTMKQAIDRSLDNPDQATKPAEFTISVGRVADFLAAVAEEKDKPGFAAAAAILKKNPGKDKVTGTVEPIERGMRAQLQIEEGVLKVIAAADKLKKK